MLVDRNDEQKYIDVWLKANEPTPSLTDLRQRFPGYQIVVWHSGSRDLGQLTAQLLQFNCEEMVRAK